MSAPSFLQILAYDFGGLPRGTDPSGTFQLRDLHLAQAFGFWRERHLCPHLSHVQS
jgi:hypothetical protein